MKISEVVTQLDSIKAEMGDVELLMAPTTISVLGLMNMPVKIARLSPWKVNEGYALIIPQYPEDSTNAPSQNTSR